MIGQAGQWTQTPSTTPLQPIKWNAHFWITFNFWWSAWLVNGIEPHLPALFSQKKWNATFWIMFNFWWSAGLVNGLEPHPPPVSSQNDEMLIFWLCSLQMIGRAGQWTWTSSTNLLQPKKWNPHFCITFNFWCWPDWSMDSNPIHHPSPANKMKCSFLDYVELLMISRAGQWNWTPSASPLQPKKWNATFWIMFNFWWSAGLVNGLEPHPPPVSSQKDEMLIFWLCSLQMICRAGQWTWTSSTTLLQPKKWNPHFCITFNVWCWPD